MILTADTIAKRDGCKTVREWILKTSMRHGKPWNKKTGGKPVEARLDFGRWLADCECGGAEYVSHTEPVFYCMSCGNAQYGGAARPVVFPKNREQIEVLVLERPVIGNDPIRQKPVIPGLSRSWNPGETLKELRKQNEVINGI
jgi:hypothetical protein